MILFHDDIIRHLHRMYFEDRHIAMVQISRNWKLITCSGSVCHYGLAHLVEGQDVFDLLGFLEAMIPETDQTFALDCVQLGSGPPADIIIAPTADTIHIVFLDASEEAEKQGKLQQATNELRLLQAEQIRLLRKLEDANQQLSRFNTELETRVAKRTEELVEANRLLKVEMAERQAAEEQLRHAQKMEAIGQLAGGVAHDFNNLMTVVNGYSEMLMASLEETDPIYEDIQEIASAGEMASNVARQLLAFSRKQVIRLESICMSTIISNLKKMLVRIIGADVSLETVLTPDLAHIAVDPGQMEQVLMNLVVNARDAMPAGGVITLRTNSVSVSESMVAEIPESYPGVFVTITVEDTGTGIEPKTLEHIFEPFFTTKAKGKGTGLGLSVVYGIIKQHGGWINVSSEIGRGTTFTVYLPVSKEYHQAVSEVGSICGLEGSGQCILIVEDEVPVQKFATRVLNLHGYKTDTASTASQAMEILYRDPEQFALVFSDIVLPDIKGLTLVENLRKMNPSLKILLTSGYTGEETDWQKIQEKAFAFLQKPYDTTSLLEAVKHALEAEM
jgi:signal transduction histidine kinase/ActR/RegA family two-component response regulator